jgi:hypothetical protein
MKIVFQRQMLLDAVHSWERRAAEFSTGGTGAYPGDAAEALMILAAMPVTACSTIRHVRNSSSSFESLDIDYERYTRRSCSGKGRVLRPLRTPPFRKSVGSSSRANSTRSPQKTFAGSAARRRNKKIRASATRPHSRSPVPRSRSEPAPGVLVRKQPRNGERTRVTSSLYGATTTHWSRRRCSGAPNVRCITRYRTPPAARRNLSGPICATPWCWQATRSALRPP